MTFRSESTSVASKFYLHFVKTRKILSLGFWNRSTYSYEWLPSCVMTCRKLHLTNCSLVATDHLPFSFSLPSLCSQLPWAQCCFKVLIGTAHMLPASHSYPCPNLTCSVLGCQFVCGHLSEQMKLQGWGKSGPENLEQIRSPNLPVLDIWSPLPRTF